MSTANLYKIIIPSIILVLMICIIAIIVMIKKKDKSYYIICSSIVLVFVVLTIDWIQPYYSDLTNKETEEIHGVYLETAKPSIFTRPVFISSFDERILLYAPSFSDYVSDVLVEGEEYIFTYFVNTKVICNIEKL